MENIINIIYTKYNDNNDNNNNNKGLGGIATDRQTYLLESRGHWLSVYMDMWVSNTLGNNLFCYTHILQ